MLVVARIELLQTEKRKYLWSLVRLTGVNSPLFDYNFLGFAHNLYPFTLGNGVICLHQFSDLWFGNSSVADRVVTGTSQVVIRLRVNK